MSKKILAVTGVIGAGKSFAVRCFAQAGWRTLDADKLCHELYADPASELTSAVAGTFGQEVLTPAGIVDRTKLGACVLDRPEELAKLTGLLYPALTARLASEIAAARRNGERLLLEIPLLFEADLPLDLDGTIAVWAEPGIRRRRLMNERHYSDSEIARREARQLPADVKLERADYALINNGSAEFLQQQIRYLITVLEEENE